jgi:hypothetical protein
MDVPEAADQPSGAEEPTEKLLHSAKESPQALAKTDSRLQYPPAAIELHAKGTGQNPVTT